MTESIGDPLLCSACFRNEGLRLDAEKLGWEAAENCPNCESTHGRKLNAKLGAQLAHRFFVVGSLHKTAYGGAPVIQFNDRVRTDLDPNQYHQEDVDLLSRILKIGFFYYGPPLWALGDIEPLKALQDPATSVSVIARVLAEFPHFSLEPGLSFYRLRKGAEAPFAVVEYDSPPDQFCGGGRLDSPDLPVLYGSPDLEVCVHECRVTVEEVVHVATLQATRRLTLLDLTAVLEERVTSFESLDMAIHLLFLAGDHSYPIARSIAKAAYAKGLDGILFPSFFSLLRTGQPFLETAWGLSTRVFPGASSREVTKIIPNIGLFGRPISDGSLTVCCLNRLYLRQAHYDLGFGPAIP